MPLLAKHITLKFPVYVFPSKPCDKPVQENIRRKYCLKKFAQTKQGNAQPRYTHDNAYALKIIQREN